MYTGVSEFCATRCIMLTYINQHHNNNPIRSHYEYLKLITTKEMYMHVNESYSAY